MNEEKLRELSIDLNEKLLSTFNNFLRKHDHSLENEQLFFLITTTIATFIMQMCNTLFDKDDLSMDCKVEFIGYISELCKKMLLDFQKEMDFKIN